MRQDFFQTNGRSYKFGSGTVEKAHLKRHKKWDDEGVASTVGTIMALMVFLAFLSMFTSQYVPVWMEENEASHMATAYGQFATLKQAVDMQILVGTIQGTSPVQMFSPVKLGAEGIPMFASPTPGYLSIYRSLSYNNVSFSYNTSASIVDHKTATGGTIKLYSPNRYYIEQEVAFENDALILKQPDGQYMKATPQLIVTSVGSMYYISYTQVDLRGDDTDYIGFGTRGVQTTMKSTTTTTFTNLTNESAPLTPTTHPYLYINHTTLYERAWNVSFNQTLSNAGMRWGLNIDDPNTDYTITSTQRPYPGYKDTFWEVSLRIKPNLVSRFSLTIAYIEISTSELGAA